MSGRRARREPVVDDNPNDGMDVEQQPQPRPPLPTGRRARTAAERTAAAQAAAVINFPDQNNHVRPLAPLVFVMVGPSGCHIYSFNSQDEEKRRRVSEAIMQLVGVSDSDDHGPSMADHLFSFIVGIFTRDAIPPEYDEEVIRVYMKIHPQPGEWTAASEETMFNIPSATTTVISYGAYEGREY